MAKMDFRAKMVKTDKTEQEAHKVKLAHQEPVNSKSQVIAMRFSLKLIRFSKVKPILKLI